MDIFVQREYFSKLNSIYEAANMDPTADKRMTNLTFIRSMFEALSIKSDLTKEDIVASYKRILENTGSFHDRIITSLHGSQKISFLHNGLPEVKPEKKSFYLSVNNENQFINNGVAFNGNDFDGKHFFNDFNINCTINNWNLSILRGKIPPSNAMFVHDPYLFTPFEKKIDKVIEFVKMYKAKTTIPYHFTAMFKNKDRNGQIVAEENITNAYKMISGIKEVKCQFIIKNKMRRDRFVFTNYNKIIIGHPFDDKEPTDFIQTFYGVGNDNDTIKKELYRFYNELRFYYNIIYNTRNYFHGQRLRWEPNNFINRLFLHLESYN